MGNATVGPRLTRRTLLGRLVALGAAQAAWLSASARPSPGGAAWAAPAAPPPPPGSPPDKGDAKAVTVSPQDPAIRAQAVQYPGIAGTMQAYVAAPAGGEIYPGILVVHDAIGLTEHIRDVARRFAKIGYVALAPDLLSRRGGTASVGDQAKVIAALESTSSQDFLDALNVSIRYLEARPEVSKTRIGMIGFGLGGSLTWFTTSVNKDVKAAVVFDAQTPDPTVAPQVTTPVLALFGEDDKSSTEGLKAFDDAMKKAGAAWQAKMEPKAGRGFFDDSRTTYAADAAKDAWKLTVDWFNKYLRG